MRTLFLVIFLLSSFQIWGEIAFLGKDGPTKKINITATIKENYIALSPLVNNLQKSIEKLQNHDITQKEADNIIKKVLFGNKQWNLLKYSGPVRHRIYERKVDLKNNNTFKNMRKIFGIINPNDDDSLRFIEKNSDINILMLVRTNSEADIETFKERSNYSGKMFLLQTDDWVKRDMGIKTYPVRAEFKGSDIVIWEGV